MSERWITALPVYNEKGYVNSVLDQVRQYSPEILVVDDGSTDGTRDLLKQRDDIHVVYHPENRGYGAALKSAFQYAIDNDYDMIVTIDCDGQHEPQRIPKFVEACKHADIVSGSRYLKRYEGDSEPPAQRRAINREITTRVNDLLGLELTDAFCGFKAYRTSGLQKLSLKENGYAMPLELWVQAVHAQLSIIELPVPLIYLDLSRTFGGNLDHAKERLDYYSQVLKESMDRLSIPTSQDLCKISCDSE